jgi:hypothetical protein
MVTCYYQGLTTVSMGRTPGYPGVHCFAAGAMKTGVYVDPNYEFKETGNEIC